MSGVSYSFRSHVAKGAIKVEGWAALGVAVEAPAALLSPAQAERLARALQIAAAVVRRERAPHVCTRFHPCTSGDPGCMHCDNCGDSILMGPADEGGA